MRSCSSSSSEISAANASSVGARIVTPFVFRRMASNPLACMAAAKVVRTGIVSMAASASFSARSWGLPGSVPDGRNGHSDRVDAGVGVEVVVGPPEPSSTCSPPVPSEVVSGLGTGVEASGEGMGVSVWFGVSVSPAGSRPIFVAKKAIIPPATREMLVAAATSLFLPVMARRIGAAYPLHLDRYDVARGLGGVGGLRIRRYRGAHRCDRVRPADRMDSYGSSADARHDLCFEHRSRPGARRLAPPRCRTGIRTSIRRGLLAARSVGGAPRGGLRTGPRACGADDRRPFPAGRSPAYVIRALRSRDHRRDARAARLARP